ncbi:MAG TPA: hypothetical protein VF893_09290 [Candidatus Bathyarchaeia archaeon]
MGTQQNNWGMGGMMGNGLTPSYYWIIPVVLIAIVATTIIGVSFYLAYPELKYIRSKGSCNLQTPSSSNYAPQTSKASTSKAGTEPPLTPQPVPIATQNCDVLLKTMTPEEQRVLKVLMNHKGKYLQKYISKEAELSRLKIHRIIARFAERGIVSIKEFGNTNEVLLAEWATPINS